MKRLALFACCWLTAATPLFAQPDDGPRKYVPFEIDPNYRQLLKNKFQLERLLKQLAANPAQLKLDAALLKDLKLDDPKMKQLAKDWIERDPSMKQMIEELLKQAKIDKQTPSTLELQKTLKSILEQPTPKVDAPLTKEPTPPNPAPPPKALERPKEDGLAKITQQAMKNAENSNIGNWLRDSPAWKDALADLQASLNNPQTSGWDLAELNKQLGLPNDKAWKLGEDWFQRLRDMPPPKLEGWKFDFKLPAVGQMPAAPNINAPLLPNINTPSLPTLSTGATWLLLIVLFALVAWQLGRWSRRATDAEKERAQLGPWPVRPEAVVTRADLVKAFDYLALLTLGLHVRCWNHHAVARRWSERVPAVDAGARALARLYESARYTNGAEALPDAERAEARRFLAQLAEAL